MCIAAVGCGLVEFGVGAAVLFTAGVRGQFVVDKTNSKPFTGKDVIGVAVSEAKGVISGTLFGRGIGGTILFGPKKNSFYMKLVNEFDPEN